MSVYKIKKETLKGLGDKIRTLTGTSAKMTPSAMQEDLTSFTQDLSRDLEEQMELVNKINVGLTAEISEEEEDAFVTRSLSVCSFNIPKIGGSAFAFCSNLISVDLPYTTIINTGAFYACKSLTTVSLPKVTSIGYNAFYACISLTSIDLPEVTTIGNAAFSGCTSLTSVSLPKVTSIGSSAFQKCSSLAEIQLPRVTTIGNAAFSGCTSLTGVKLTGSLVCVLQSNTAFAGTPLSDSSLTGAYGSIYVPESLVNGYITASNWKSYSSRIVGI